MSFPKIFTFATTALMLCFAVSGAATADQTAPPRLPNPFFVFDNGVGRGRVGFEKQAKLLKELGYDGISFEGTQHIPEMLRALDAQGLKMFATYVAASVDANQPPYEPGLEKAIEQLKGRGTLIWIHLGGGTPSSDAMDGRAVAVLREIANMAEKSGLRAALYPHVGEYVCRVQDALRLIPKVGRKNLGMCFNLCHFLKLDNEKNVELRLHEAMPHLFMVNINGADGGRTNEIGWDRLIQTLDRGTFDVGRVLKTLRQMGYTGPIGLQGFGIPGDIRDNLTRSMAAWRKLSAEAAAAVTPETDGMGYTDTPRLPNSPWRVHDRARPQPPMVAPHDSEDVFASAPTDATVLFDGRDLSRWEAQKPDGSWVAADPQTIEDGCFNILKTGRVRTKQQFADCHLHIEWATPAKPDGNNLNWGNSGVFFMGRYELQIIESHDSRIYADGIAGAIYGQTPPLVNASRGPGHWQTFDAVFTAPRFDGNRLVASPYLTVFWNGTLVQDRTRLMGETRHGTLPEYTSHQSTGPIELQQHGSAVRFRNIWIRPLGTTNKKEP